MRTDELVTLLANGPLAVEPYAWRRRYALALGAGLLGAVVLLMLSMGVRADMTWAAQQPFFWVKIAFPAALAAAAVVAVVRLSRPGIRLGRAAFALAAPVLVVWGLGGMELAEAEPEAYRFLIWGQTWLYCPFRIALLSTPVFVSLLWAMRELAPTQLTLAGAAAGLLAGAAGATVYALYCPEMSATFIGIWYVLGMLIPTALGAAIGPRLLRW